MGTPVPLKSRENMCIGADPEVKTRQLTEEERRYYDSLEKPKKKAVFILPEDESLYIERCDWEMSKNKKIDPPEKQVLIEKLVEVEGSKTKRMKHAAEAFAVSMTTMYVWTKELNIEFDKDGKVIMPAEYSIDPNELTLGVQPSNGQVHYQEEEAELTTPAGLVPQIAYAEYSIGSMLVGINFKDTTVKVRPDRFTFDEAAGLVELLNDIL